MRLIPLGTAAGGVPRPGDAGSGYLVAGRRTKVLLDIGNGTLGNLARHTDWHSIDAILLSHLHFDHLLDLQPFLLPRRTGVRVIGPPGTRRTLAAFFRLFSDHGGRLYRERALVTEHRRGASYRVGDFRVRFHRVRHTRPAWAIEVREGARRLVYSGDTERCPALVSAARRAALLLSEATWQTGAPPERLDGHMTAADAATVARDAGAKRLLLTHIVNYLDRRRSQREAAAIFPNTDIARVNREYRV
ncbi:MAG: MBL fold metallo-hydrolase [Methanobacteriota archaeon]